MATIYNFNNQAIDFETVVEFMDTGVLKAKFLGSYESEQTFFEEYAAAHFEKFNENFEPYFRSTPMLSLDEELYAILTQG